MKTGIKFLMAVVCLAALFAFSVMQTSTLSKAKWLEGTWENKTSRGSIYETWKRKNDTEFAGMSYIIKEGDTIVFENIQLVQNQKELYYIPTVKNQNEGLPIRFAAKTITESQLIFENLQHDFPQMISYTRINSDSLVAVISGIKNGQKRNQTFRMKRVN
jgi:signal peptidase I